MTRSPALDTTSGSGLLASPAAIAAVVEAESPRLWRAARAAGLGEQDAEDAVQETFLTFLRRLDDFDGSSSVGTWLYGILLNKIRERRRGHAREQLMEDIETVLDARFDAAGNWIRPPPQGDAAAALHQARAWLEQCLDGLPERYRLAFVLKEAEGRPTQELCNILAVSANNLGVILFRARAALRECLESKGLKGNLDATL